MTTAGLTIVIVPPSADASHAATRAVRAPAGSCRLYGSGGHTGYWSSCFPTLHLDISWDGYPSDGEDKGSEVGREATAFWVYKNHIGVENEQSSSLADRALITGTLSDPDCGAAATPSYDGHGPGLLENDYSTDSFDGFYRGRPVINGYFEPNVPPFSVSYPNCEGGSYQSSYGPGTPLYGSKCPADPRKKPEFYLDYGKYSSSGSITAGRHDTWDFDCSFEPRPLWTTTGEFTMTENSCSRDRSGPGYKSLSKSTKAALRRFYRGLEAQGGCYHFKYGWTTPKTHAQNVDVVVGFRPMGLVAFARTAMLREYVVPVVHSIARSAGLCGPTIADPTRLQTKYRLGKQKAPSCHLG